MATQLSSELKSFIISFCKEMKIKNIDIGDLGLDTSVDLDLNIFELDLDVFMGDFVKRFDINTATFEWGKQFVYPSGKGMGLFYSIFRSFNYKKDWVKQVCRKLYKPKLFVNDFQEAIDHKAFV